jgi:adenine-specific DNA methylase
MHKYLDYVDDKKGHIILIKYNGTAKIELSDIKGVLKEKNFGVSAFNKVKISC